MERTLASLPEVGIDLEGVTEKLQTEGVAAFAASHDKLIAALEQKRQVILVS